MVSAVQQNLNFCECKELLGREIRSSLERAVKVPLPAGG